jgi:hypothetical protein
MDKKWGAPIDLNNSPGTRNALLEGINEEKDFLSIGNFWKEVDLNQTRYFDYLIGRGKRIMVFISLSKDMAYIGMPRIEVDRTPKEGDQELYDLFRIRLPLLREKTIRIPMGMMTFQLLKLATENTLQLISRPNAQINYLRAWKILRASAGHNKRRY